MTKLTLSSPDRSAIRRLAGSRSFARGEAYLAQGRVGALAEHRGALTAKVRGTRDYRVRLSIEGGELGFSCTCPVGADGDFCKHCVAVALAWIEGGQGAAAKTVEPKVTMDDVRAYLAGLSKDALVGLAMEQAMADDRLRRKLLLETARRGADGLDLATYRRAVDEAVDTGGFVDYRESWDYAQGIEETADSIERLLGQGHAAAVVELAEYALAAVEEALGSIDDSDGVVGGVRERLEELHLKACRKARPDAEELARRLFAWELRTEWDTFFGAAERYAGVLGKKGLDAYRRLAEAEWERVPPLGPGTRGSYDGRRFRITHIMETLARRTGRVEDLVAVKERDLSSAYSYLQVAEIYRKARRHDLALEWAERGLAAFPERTDPRLREFLAGEYHRHKRHAEAIELAWAGFAERPTLETYRDLKRHAGKAGQWSARREKALARLREGLAERGRQAHRTGWFRGGPGASELVRVYLWEKDPLAALREARTAGCSEELWLELAAKLEADHPEEALPIYQARIEPVVERKDERAYRQAVELLRKVSRLWNRLGRGREFAPYLESVRQAHGRKRNLMKLLDRARWSG